MTYEYGYEIASLVFLALICVSFFRRRRLPSATHGLFSYVLLFGLADIALDIAGSLMVENAATVPSALLQIVNTLFYALQISFPLVLAVYVLLLTGYPRKKRKRTFSLFAIPSTLFLLALLTNPDTRLFFYVDEHGIYQRGVAFLPLLICAGFYLLLTCLIVVFNRRKLTRMQTYSILTLIVLIIAATLIQLFFPAILLTGLAISFAITIMFLNYQNPTQHTDSLTQVFNRSGLIQVVKTFFEEETSFQFITVDMDNTRRFNRIFGMPAGNAALRSVAAFLDDRSLRRSWVFRFMGDRFVVVTTKRETHLALLSKIKARFEEQFWIGDNAVTLSATVCHMDDASLIGSTEMFVNLLEITVPELKKGGKGAFYRLSEDNLNALRRQEDVEAALRFALEHDGLDVFFQPLYSRKEHRFISAEALVRLRTSEFGPISPAEFIPIAERNGLVLHIDEAVLHKTCRFIKEHKPFERLGLSSISINLSAVEMFQAGLTDKLSGILSQYGVDPQRIYLEVTETATTSSYEIIRQEMQKLATCGFHFSLDDYGTGYANIARLASLPFDMVKVDISILQSHKESIKHAILFDDTVHMLQRLGFATVVEGVESIEEARVVQRMNVDYIQGYYYAKPMAESLFISLLENQMSD